MSATATKAKAVNYTNEQTAELVAAYKATPTRATVDAFALKFGKGVRSVIMKLTREGVYQKAEYVTKAGEKVQPKDDLADAIGKALGLTEPDIESLTKANKSALKAIGLALAKLKPEETPADTAGDTETE